MNSRSRKRSPTLGTFRQAATPLTVGHSRGTKAKPIERLKMPGFVFERVFFKLTISIPVHLRMLPNEDHIFLTHNDVHNFCDFR
jgi:hypothetical protein